MKNLFCTISFLFLLHQAPLLAQQPEVLTNESVIELYTKKLPSSIILGKIKSAKNSFNLDTDALIHLTENNIPEDIINAMVEAAGDESRHITVIDPNNPLHMQPSGIYIYTSTDQPKLTQLEATVYSQSKNSGSLASSMTYGISKVKTSVTLTGASAQTQIKDQLPVFYFYFDITESSLSQTGDWWFKTASSPNEFLLVKFSENKKSREVTTGSANIAGASVGVDDKNKADFKMEKVANGIYRVYFEKPLPEGEYCFMYAGTMPAGFASMNKVFDFGITK